MATINCPHCNTSLNLPENAVGKIVKCTQCNERFQAPAPQAVAIAATPAAQAQPAASVPPTAAQPSVVLTAPARRCVQCGFQGYMPRKWASWVVPTAVITGLCTAGVGLLFLLVPKQHCCPQCGATFG
jgi:hypothetical protein